MSYNKKQLYRVTNRLYRELEENPDYIILRKIRGFQGEYDGNRDINRLQKNAHSYAHTRIPSQMVSRKMRNMDFTT